MAKIIDTFEPGSWEHEQLRIAAEMLTKKSRNNTRYYVDNVYFDLGRGWMWTTILAENERGSYQALSPVQQEEIIVRTDLDNVTDEYFSDTWCLDR